MIKIIKNLTIFFLALTVGLMLSFEAFLIKDRALSKKQQSPVLTASLTPINDNNFHNFPLIPPHIDLFDFYKTYGQRLLENDNLKIISREEWGADNILCQKEKCSEIPYDPKNSFSPLEHLKLQTLVRNYINNFQKFDAMFLQTKTQINGVTYSYLPVEEIVIHHTAGKFTTDFNESKKELQRIYFLHTVQRGWQDIGYHYLIDGAGRIYEGTLGGKYANGAHTYWHNNGTIGIALMGDFRPGHDTFTKPMQESLIKLIKYIIQEYHWNINSPQFYLKKPDFSGREWSTLLIKGHQELDIIRTIPTSCPGLDPQVLREVIYPHIFQNQPL